MAKPMANQEQDVAILEALLEAMRTPEGKRRLREVIKLAAARAADVRPADSVGQATGLPPKRSMPS